MSKGCVRNLDLTLRFTTRTENSRAIPVFLIKNKMINQKMSIVGKVFGAVSN